jgi:hypothetical protein
MPYMKNWFVIIKLVHKVIHLGNEQFSHIFFNEIGTILCPFVQKKVSLMPITSHFYHVICLNVPKQFSYI